MTRECAMLARASALGALACTFGALACKGDDAPDDAATPDAPADAAPLDGDLSTASFQVEFSPVPIEDAPIALSDFVFVPGRGMEVFVALHRGAIHHYRIDETGAHLLGSMPFAVVNNRECGLIALAVDPDFETNHYLYVGYCASIQRAALARVTVDFDDFANGASTAVEIISIENPLLMAGVHNFGLPVFDADGSLWLPAGDKADEDAAQDPSDNLGSLLHIIPSRDPSTGGYTPVATEPVVPGASLDVFAYGLRSPWRTAIGSHGIWIAEVGENTYEEVDLVTAPGENFGWRTYEGPCTDCVGITQPIVAYDHSSSHPYVIDDPDAGATRQRAVFISPEYHAPPGADPYEGALDGKLLFGDFSVGFVRALEIDAARNVVLDAHVGHLEGATAFRIGPDGYFYATSFGGFDASTPLEGGFHRVELLETRTP